MIRSLVRRAAVVAAIFGTAYVLAPRLDAGEQAVYAVIDIDGIGGAALAELKDVIKPEWTVEADKDLLVLATP